MTRLTLSILALSICTISFEQTKNSIELNFIGRFDRTNYVSNFAGRAYNDTNKLSGFSYGINGIVKRKITKSISVYLGLGYYQLRIDKIRGQIPFDIPGVRTSRNIDYRDPESTDLLYSTTKYHYNNVAITIGFDKTFLIEKGFGFDIAPEIIGYKTVSQKYEIGYSSNYYTTHNSKPLEFGVNVKNRYRKRVYTLLFTTLFINPSLSEFKGRQSFL